MADRELKDDALDAGKVMIQILRECMRTLGADESTSVTMLPALIQSKLHAPVQPVSQMSGDAMSKLVDDMCMTWRHDFGLQKSDPTLTFATTIGCGMTDVEREGLRTSMRQIVTHNFLPLLASHPSNAVQDAPVTGLLLCPFCGNKGELHTDGEYATCKDCSYDLPVGIWNSRHVLAATVPQVAQSVPDNWIAERIREELTLVGHSLERSHLDGDAWAGTIDEITALVKRISTAPQPVADKD